MGSITRTLSVRPQARVYRMISLLNQGHWIRTSNVRLTWRWRDRKGSDKLHCTLILPSSSLRQETYHPYKTFFVRSSQRTMSFSGANPSSSTVQERISGSLGFVAETREQRMMWSLWNFSGSEEKGNANGGPSRNKENESRRSEDPGSGVNKWQFV